MTTGGTAGNVVANRLTENPGTSVLILEAGGSNAGVLDIIVPFFCPRATPNTPQDWNYTTVPQVGMNGRSISYPRGHVLGGSSSVNYMVYTRGSKEDFDRFANITGDAGWSWDRLAPYFKKNEHFNQPVDHHNTTGQFDPAIHSFDGINSVTLASYATSLDFRVIETTKELKSEFPFNLDMNSGNPIGWGQMTVKNGSRSSSATSYLGPQFIGRPNLHVLVNARVTRVLPTASNDFRTVDHYVETAIGKRLTITAKKEVVLSAGSIGSPSILMYSGIGNSSALQQLGIKPLHNLPSVGQNLTDHSLLPMAWLVNSTDTFETAERNATLAAEELVEWNSTRMGPLVNTPLGQIGWLRVPDNSSIFERFPDPAAGPNTPHYELIFTNGGVGPPPPIGNFMGIVAAVVSPASRGWVMLNSSDPLAAPLINPNLVGSEVDVFFMRYAVRSALRIAAAKAFDGYVISPAFPLNSTSTDDEIDAFIRENTGTVFHPVGTCSITPRHADFGVVDPDLRVKGLTGLRVVDLSVMPLIAAAHTQVSAYMIGERGADIIKEAWNL
ncbi:aryl-alcohol-oxidase from pleurotus Eryingii [Mycena alexandri]|uniref:Aryl-alcohol-oxidase from pleurotus Eryingii n=1 Tax=Mycena alexandri TaxID=1745969 RepID=A0AAD6TG18_9AGAR|nr:aryl-alcohol-oxidase from pleurotus Eryingii [Mycena alexandri]